MWGIRLSKYFCNIEKHLLVEYLYINCFYDTPFIYNPPALKESLGDVWYQGR